MIPEVRNPGSDVLRLADAIPAKLAAIPGRRRSAIYHALLGLAIGWAMNEDNLVQCATTWIRNGDGCGLATAHKYRKLVMSALGIPEVAAAGMGLPCDPRSKLSQHTRDTKAACLIAARRLAKAGLIRHPKMDQVPLGPPLVLPLVKRRGKKVDACPSCEDAKSFSIQEHPGGHRTGWCHRCQVGFTIMGWHARQWALGRKRGPSANGKPSPDLVKRATQPVKTPLTRPIRNNDPGRAADDPGRWPWEATGLGAGEVVARLGGVDGRVGDPGRTAWVSRGGWTVRVHVVGVAMVVVRKWDGAVLFNSHATLNDRAAVWALIRAPHGHPKHPDRRLR